jgi:ABC-type branched-subunit amino acid transport system substrate-binding protein
MCILSIGIADHLLPNTTLLFAARDSRLTYSQSIQAGLDLTYNVFNGLGIQAAIGSSSASSTKGLAEIGQDRGVPQIAYTAFSDFSHGENYPNLLNVYPKNGYQGTILGNFVHQQGWKRVALFYATDNLDYYDGASTEFQDICNNHDIDVSAYSFDSTLVTDYSSMITQALVLDLRVVVIFMSTPTAVTFLQQASKHKLIGPDITLLMCQDSSPFSLTPAMFPNTTDYASLFHGSFGVVSPIRDWVKLPQGQNFLTKWRALKNTVSTVNGTKVCNSTTDDDKGFLLYKGYPGYNTSSKLACYGVTFSKFFMNGSNMDIAPPFIYDSVYAFAYGLHDILYDQKTTFTAARIKQSLLGISFVGATGNISFSKGRSSLARYGIGDRLEGFNYGISNFDGARFKSGKVAYETVGRMSSDGVYVSCVGTDTNCSASIAYNSIDNKIPSDRAPAHQMKDLVLSDRSAFQAVGGIIAAVSILLGCLVMLNRTKSVVKASQPPLLALISVGCLIAGARIILEAYDASTDVCVAQLWAGHMSFAFVVIPMLLCVWRVFVVVVNAGMSKVKLTESTTLRVFALCLSPFVIILSIATAVSPPQLIQVSTFAINAQEDYKVVCSYLSSPCEITLYVLEILMLVACLAFCVLVKDTPRIVNQSVKVGIGKA